MIAGVGVSAAAVTVAPLVGGGCGGLKVAQAMGRAKANARSANRVAFHERMRLSGLGQRKRLASGRLCFELLQRIHNRLLQGQHPTLRQGRGKGGRVQLFAQAG